MSKLEPLADYDSSPDSPRTPKRPLTSSSCKMSNKLPGFKQTPKGGSYCKTPGSSIPLPTKLRGRSPHHTPLGIPIQKTDKHTLEMQFINKSKRLTALKNDLIEKQKPVFELHQNLVKIKRELEEHGKIVVLEEIKLLPCTEESVKSIPQTPRGEEAQNPEVVTAEMKLSIEEIPRTLIDICRNVLERRHVVVDLLESITKNELKVEDLTDKIGLLKSDGLELQSSMDGVVQDFQGKIDKLIKGWEVLLTCNRESSRFSEEEVNNLKNELMKQEGILEQTNAVLKELQRKFEDKKGQYELQLKELNDLVEDLQGQLEKQDQDLEVERKQTNELKSKTSTSSQTIKSLRNKIQELEAKNKDVEEANSNLTQKLKLAQDQAKNKEMQWSKERDQLSKDFKKQESLLGKLSKDRSELEIRCTEVELKQQKQQFDFELQLKSLQQEKQQVETQLEQRTKEKEELEESLQKMQETELETRQEMDMLISLTKASPYEDKIKQYEFEKQNYLNRKMGDGHPSSEEKRLLLLQHQNLLQESEEKLRQKSHEVTVLSSEIRHLKVRQELLEEQNCICPSKELQEMIEKAREKLNEVVKKSLENEQKISNYEVIIEKQTKQMNEMENMLKYRENLIGILSSTRDELALDKESLTRYTNDLRTALSEVTKDRKMLERFVKELQEKVELKEKQIDSLEKEIQDLEVNLAATNEKRFKLQNTLGCMEKELQSIKAITHQLSDVPTRYDHYFNNSLVKETPQIIIQQLHNHVMNCKKLNKTESKLIRQLIEVSLTENFHNKNFFLVILQLLGKRYRNMKKQTEESYEDLTIMFKFSAFSRLSEKSLLRI